MLFSWVVFGFNVFWLVVICLLVLIGVFGVCWVVVVVYFLVYLRFACRFGWVDCWF